jgi:hypothetical protein
MSTNRTALAVLTTAVNQLERAKYSRNLDRKTGGWGGGGTVLMKYLGPVLPSFITKSGVEKETRLNRTHIERIASSRGSCVGQLMKHR